MTEKFENKYKGIFQQYGLDENRIRDIELALYSEKEYLLKLDKTSFQTIAKGVFDIKDLLEIIFLSLCESRRYKIFDEYFLHTSPQEIYIHSRPLQFRVPGLYEDEILEELSQRLSRIEVVKKVFTCKSVPLGFSYSNIISNLGEFSQIKDLIIKSIAHELSIRRDMTSIGIAKRISGAQMIPIKQLREIDLGKFSKIILRKPLFTQVLPQLQTFKNWIPKYESGLSFNLAGRLGQCEIYETSLQFDSIVLDNNEIIAFEKTRFPRIIFGVWLELCAPLSNSTSHSPQRLEDYQIIENEGSIRLYRLIN